MMLGGTVIFCFKVKPSKFTTSLIPKYVSFKLCPVQSLISTNGVISCFLSISPHLLQLHIKHHVHCDRLHCN